MKHSVPAIILSFLVTLVGWGQSSPRFEDFFLDETLRIDYFHAGDKSEEILSLDRLYRQGIWAGNPNSLIDPSLSGRYRVKLYDVASNRLIYSRGFDAYFGEYKTTVPAKNGIKRTFHETALVPYPRYPVLFVIESRDRDNLYRSLFTHRIDPGDYHIIRESPARGDKIYEILNNGDPHSHVDLLFVAEGYTAADQGKFEQDLRRLSGLMFGWEPYRSMKQKFNIRGIFSPSPEGGVDEPRQGIYRHTLLNASFNAMDTDRYLMTEENETLRDVAAQAPYDAVLIMVNSKRYGGGGIYNDYTIFTSDGSWNEYVFLHEFGHAFAGLADEYYTRDVSYEEFFPQGIEPVEPNITALLNPAQLKWKDLVTPGLPIPTPWGQETYDSLTTLRDSLSRSGSTDRELMKALNTRIQHFFVDHPLRGKIGAFEGAGYVPKGLYRPTVNSLMNQFNEQEKTLYRVNEQAITRVIRYYTE